MIHLSIEADQDAAVKLGLLPEEYKKIKEILGRNPNFTELSIFSVMWSEHCSYKNSIRWLKTLPRQGKRLLAEAGQENAGLVDIGGGLACAFKIESHNHPSAIEPYQGAATGVGTKPCERKLSTNLPQQRRGDAELSTAIHRLSHVDGFRQR